MSEAIKDHYAFPITSNDLTLPRGMTLRDYFAAAALSNYAARYQDDMSAEDIASQCYSLANWMLIQREKGTA